jgi:hypothetical protein
MEVMETSENKLQVLGKKGFTMRQRNMLPLSSG